MDPSDERMPPRKKKDAKRPAAANRPKARRSRSAPLTVAEGSRSAPLAVAEGSRPKPARRRSTPRCPVVGIGASAGGLEALELFLRHVPPDSGLAWVIVQHLDPTHEGMLVPILKRATSLPVDEVQETAKVEPH